MILLQSLVKWVLIISHSCKVGVKVNIQRVTTKSPKHYLSGMFMKSHKSLSIAKLQTTSVLIFQDALDLFNIYTFYIRPFIAESFKLEHSAVWTETTSFIKEDKKWFQVNNFELFHLIKSPSIDFNVLRQEVPVKYILKDDFSLNLCFHELIELIALHNKKLDIKLIYRQLKTILDKQMNQQLFGKNIFAVTKFCELIDIAEPTYHARRSGILL